MWTWVNDTKAIFTSWKEEERRQCDKCKKWTFPTFPFISVPCVTVQSVVANLFLKMINELSSDIMMGSLN